MRRKTQDAAFRRLVGSALVGSALLIAAGCGDAGTGTLRFEVRAGNVERGGELTAGKSADDRVSVGLPGEAYDPPVEVKRPASREAATRSTPLEASAAHFGAFSTNDPDWIVANYARGEREEIRRLVEEQAMEGHGRAVLEDFDEKRIHGRARLSVSDTPYELLFVSYHEEGEEERWMTEVFVEEDDAWYRSDVLMGNPRFQVVRAALRSGRITERG